MKRFLLVLTISLAALGTRATHLLGGEFRYDHMSGLTYRIEVHLWSNLVSPTDMPEIVIDLGGGAIDTVPQTFFIDDPTGSLCGPVRYSEYTTTHTYPGPGTYTMRFTGSNRTGGIVNIPNSVSQPFSVSALLVISPVLGENHSAQFTSIQTSDWIWSTLIHDPSVIDPDGDSLSFELVIPQGVGGNSVIGYGFPEQFTSPGGYAWLDPGTGIFLWHFPDLLGEFVIAIRCNEWRNSTLIGQVTRDMTMCVHQLQTTVAEQIDPDVPVLERSGTVLFLVGNSSEKLSYRISNAEGRVIRTGILPPGRVPIELDGFSSGLYFVQVVERRGAATTLRFLKD